jgi:hypothetical protein
VAWTSGPCVPVDGQATSESPSRKPCVDTRIALWGLLSSREAWDVVFGGGASSGSAMTKACRRDCPRGCLGLARTEARRLLNVTRREEESQNSSSLQDCCHHGESKGGHQ